MLLVSCISEFDPNINEGPKRLVVEGSITTGNRSAIVKLSQTEPFDEPFSDSLRFAVSGANVLIENNFGKIERLVEEPAGIYRLRDESFKAEVGGIYRLRITLANGEEFESKPEIIHEVPPLDTVEYRFITKPFQANYPSILSPPLRVNFDPDFGRGLDVPISDPFTYLNHIPDDLLGRPSYLFEEVPLPRFTGAAFVKIMGEQFDFENSPRLSNDFIRVGFKSTDTGGQSNFYKWDVKLIFKIKSYPEHFTLRQEKQRTGTEAIVGNDTFPVWRNYVRFPKDCCNTCWVETTFPTFISGHDINKDGGKISGDIADIPINNFMFQDRIYIQVVQHSLTHEAFLFYNSLSKQINQVGSVFDTSPGLTPGNVYNINDPDDIVLGYFSASDIKTSGFYIDVEDLPELTFYNLSLEIFRFALPADNFIFSDDCREISNEFMVSSTEKPLNWVDSDQ